MKLKNNITLVMISPMNWLSINGFVSLEIKNILFKIIRYIIVFNAKWFIH